MIWLIILNYICLFIFVFYTLTKLDKLTKRAKRVDVDINSLRQNDDVLSSTLNKIHQELKNHEKKEKFNEKKRRIVVG